MQPVPFVFGVHCHQPVGNLDSVFEEATRKAYRPFLDVLSAHPEVKAAIHYSGCLSEWLQVHHPEILDTLQILSSIGQVEVMGSAFYEPVLPVIPERDRVGQIQMMSRFLERITGKRPKGMWLTERVWEPHLVSSLAQGGIEWIPIDDDHLVAAGVPRNEVGGCYLTEDGGHALRLISISHELRYAIPARSPEDVIDLIVELGQRSGAAPCFFDDGEKFGLWPGSHDHMYQERWLHRFFELLEEDPRVQTVAPSELASGPIRGRVYIPATCTREMAGWALPPAQAVIWRSAREAIEERGLAEVEPFLQGGLWRNFLVRYPEANLLQKRCARLSRELSESRLPSDHPRLRDARRHLYRAQCNCAYWHGMFGGLYLSHLRRALWNHLVAGEAALFSARAHAATGIRADIDSLELDGGQDVLIEGLSFGAWLKPSYGGSLLSLDLRDTPRALVGTISRHREAYHLGADLPDWVAFDEHRRLAFVDRFFSSESDLDTLPTAAADLDPNPGGHMDHELRQRAGQIFVRMQRDTELQGAGIQGPLAIRKALSVLPDQVHVLCEWELTWGGDSAVEVVFAPEVNLSLLQDPRYPEEIEGGGQRFPVDEARTLGASSEVMVHSPADARIIRVHSTEEFVPAIYPVETWTEGGDGPERLLQGLCIHACRTLTLQPGQPVRLDLSLEVCRSQDAS